MNDKIPFLHLHATYLELKSDINAANNRVLNSGWYILKSLSDRVLA